MIQRFYVHNFRCLENFKLPIAGSPSSLLIGRNGTGKSTVSFALEVVQSIARGTNRVGQLLKPDDFSRGRSDIPMRFEIEAKLDGAVYQYNLALELPEGFKELRITEEKLSVDSKDVYSRIHSQMSLSRTSRDGDAKFLIDWHLVALPIIQELSERDPIYIFKNWLARMIILAPIPSQIHGDSTGDTLLPNRPVTNFAEWFSGLLAHSPAVYNYIDGYLREIMPDLKDIKNPAIGREFRSLSVQFQQDQADLSVPFKSLSDGEKCFFICALVVASNKAYGPIFCFWDEPDNHLSISEVGQFVMVLRRMFEEKGQLIVTSHNSEAIRHFSEENILLLHRRSHSEPTLIRPVSEVQINGELINALIRDDVEL